MTYNVFGGTLNPTQPQPTSESTALKHVLAWNGRIHAVESYCITLLVIVAVQLCRPHTPVISVVFCAGAEAVCMGAVVSGEDSRDSQQRTESIEKSCVPECCCIIFMDLCSISGPYAHHTYSYCLLKYVLSISILLSTFM